ncbi:MAG: DUF2911 domain-containing protein [Bacteroidia bacterium]|nr:DUF2911 domain-containing protein [Bacteroidia bacterium]
MKQILILICAAILAACHAGSSAQHMHGTHASGAAQPADTAKGSPHRVAMADIGSAHVHIEYNAPAVRGRIIWGGLVPYGEPWVTGAHHATSIMFSAPVQIAGARIRAGTYAFFTIPGRESWVLILNKNWRQHLTDEYDAADDVLRWTVQPEPHAHTERLTYSVVPQSANTGMVTIDWDTLRIRFEIIR